METPLVSIITNSYNCGKYLRANIESMLRQDYDNWEHIIVDCGSSDESLDILSAVAHKKLQQIKVPFCGVSKGRDIGIHHAKGEIIAILDADDMVLPQRLRKQVDILTTQPTVVGVGSGIVRIDETSGKRKTFIYPSENKNIIHLLHAGINPIPHSTLAFRRSSYEAIGGYSDVIEKAEDFDFLLRLVRIGCLASIPEPLILYSFRQDSHTNRHKPKGRNESFYAILALILSSTKNNELNLSHIKIEKWLDEIGLKGINGILCRWAFRTIYKNLIELDLISLGFLMKTIRNKSWDAIGCIKKDWWKYTDTPEHIIGQILADTDNKGCVA